MKSRILPQKRRLCGENGKFKVGRTICKIGRPDAFIGRYKPRMGLIFVHAESVPGLPSAAAGQQAQKGPPILQSEGLIFSCRIAAQMATVPTLAAFIRQL
jgi:hypothetical protein